MLRCRYTLPYSQPCLSKSVGGLGERSWCAAGVLASKHWAGQGRTGNVGWQAKSREETKTGQTEGREVWTGVDSRRTREGETSVQRACAVA